MMTQRTLIDTVSIVCREAPEAVLVKVRVLFPDMRTEENEFGMIGYKHSTSLYVGKLVIGWLAWGGKHQRGTVYLYLDGKGCARIDDWSVVIDLFQPLKDARLSRVDIALDTFRGEVTYEDVEAALAAGEFNPERGRKPSVDRWGGENSEGENTGRTLYVGKRTTSKFGRFYEKGFEQLKGVDTRAFEVAGLSLGDVPVPDGAGPVGSIMRNWFRCEVEFKRAGGDRDLEWRMLVAPDFYFAGAYPFCANLLPALDPVPLRRVVTDTGASFAKMLAYHRMVTGNFMRDLHTRGASPGAVFEALVGDDESKRFASLGTPAELDELVALLERAYRTRHEHLAAVA